MTSKLTRERIELIANFHRAMTLPPSHDEIEELARMALSAMDSEPVAYIGERMLEDLTEGYRSCGRVWPYIKDELSGESRIPLYRHAQPAPVVDADDNFYSWFGREWQENYQHNQYTTAAKQMLGVMAESAWKAGRRAAMLQDEPVTTANKLGNSPGIPDTWIPVSERLPEEGGRYWCYVEEQNDLGKSHYQWNCSWNGERWWVESENGGIVTHWMPLPAAPQGVK
ncbi:DUF551 domain-containing protein [Klebsiella sp. CN_Kp104]|uniref:DUF551 domain-containing protein n=1 Tax=Klebsiella sp. CN_Kp104 TaxID=3153423 RepID=UPI0032B5734B